MTYPIHIFLSNVFCKQVITSFTAFQVMPKETSCQFHSTFCSISEVLQWITSIICINEFSQTIRIYFHHSRFVHIQNVTKIKGKLWRFFFWSCLEIGCRHGITVLCGASYAQAVGVPHLNDGILGRFEFLRSSPAFFFQLCSWLLQTLTIGFTAKKSGIKNDGWDPPFFDNEDTLVRWVWRHWKSYHKHFFPSKNE